MPYDRISPIETRLSEHVAANCPAFVGDKPCNRVFAGYDSEHDVAQVLIEGNGLMVRFVTEKFAKLSFKGGANGVYAGRNPITMSNIFSALSEVAKILATDSDLAVFAQWLNWHKNGAVKSTHFHNNIPLCFSLEFVYTGYGTFPNLASSTIFITSLESGQTHEVSDMQLFMNTIHTVAAIRRREMVDSLLLRHPLNACVAYRHVLVAEKRWCVGLWGQP